MTLGLTAKIERLHRALHHAELPHAFGGALALAFCVEEPRATKDIDLNVFIGVDRVPDLLAALPAQVRLTVADIARLEHDAQTRAWWDQTPIDLFLSNHPFHRHAESNRRTVAFAAIDKLPVLACTDLAVFKAFFARPKDAVDVAAMVTAGVLDLAALERTVGALLGDAERLPFFTRVRDFVAESPHS